MLTVKERGQFVATLRYVHVSLMETLAAWVPTTPEMEVKLLFGEHIWDVAQHADASASARSSCACRCSTACAPPMRTWSSSPTWRRSGRPRSAWRPCTTCVLPALVGAPAALRRADRQAGRRADGAHPRALPRRHDPHDRRGAARCARSCRRCSWPTGNGWPSPAGARGDARARWPPPRPRPSRWGRRCARRRRYQDRPRRRGAQRSGPRAVLRRSSTCTTTCPMSGARPRRRAVSAPTASTTRRSRRWRSRRSAWSTFPDAPWELRMELARQCWDEARHAELVVSAPEGAGWLEGHVPDRQPGLVGGGDARLAGRAAGRAAPHVRGRLARHRDRRDPHAARDGPSTRRPR